MARNYALNASTAVAVSATLPLLTLIGSTSVRTKVNRFDFSSESAPNDHNVKLVWQRCTTTGTPGSSLTPQALDPGDPAAGTTSGLATFSVGPTLTANALLWAQSLNQRITAQWAARPGEEMVIPATSGNGLALMSTVNDSGFTLDMTVHFQE